MSEVFTDTIVTILITFFFMFIFSSKTKDINEIFKNIFITFIITFFFFYIFSPTTKENFESYYSCLEQGYPNDFCLHVPIQSKL